MAITPEPKAVARQPKPCIDQATRNTKRPPIAPPNWSADSARAPLLEPLNDRDAHDEVETPRPPNPPIEPGRRPRCGSRSLNDPNGGKPERAGGAGAPRAGPPPPHPGPSPPPPVLFTAAPRGRGGFFSPPPPPPPAPQVGPERLFSEGGFRKTTPPPPQPSPPENLGRRSGLQSKNAKALVSMLSRGGASRRRCRDRRTRCAR